MINSKSITFLRPEQFELNKGVIIVAYLTSGGTQAMAPPPNVFLRYVLSGQCPKNGFQKIILEGTQNQNQVGSAIVNKFSRLGDNPNQMYIVMPKLQGETNQQAMQLASQDPICRIANINFINNQAYLKNHPTNLSFNFADYIHYGAALSAEEALPRSINDRFLAVISFYDGKPFEIERTFQLVDLPGQLIPDTIAYENSKGNIQSLSLAELNKKVMKQLGHQFSYGPMRVPKILLGEANYQVDDVDQREHYNEILIDLKKNRLSYVGYVEAIKQLYPYILTGNRRDVERMKQYDKEAIPAIKQEQSDLVRIARVPKTGMLQLKANKPIKKGTFLAAYNGILTTQANSNNNPDYKIILRDVDLPLLENAQTVTPQMFLDAREHGNFMRFANAINNDVANAAMVTVLYEGMIVLVHFAKKDIAEGEPILWDYSEKYAQNPELTFGFDNQGNLTGESRGLSSETFATIINQSKKLRAEAEIAEAKDDRATAEIKLSAAKNSLKILFFEKISLNKEQKQQSYACMFGTRCALSFFHDNNANQTKANKHYEKAVALLQNTQITLPAGI